MGLLRLWRHITWCEDLRLWWGLKKNGSPCWDLSNGMLHVACTQGNQVDFWFLVVGSQTATLTPNLSFGYNLCFRSPNGWCEPISDIYVSIDFQWYKGFFKKMGFDPYNRALKIREFICECEGSFPYILCTPGSMWCDSQVFFLAYNLATPLPWSRAQGLGLRQKFKTLNLINSIQNLTPQRTLVFNLKKFGFQ
jgi:hypothetical protein